MGKEKVNLENLRKEREDVLLLISQLEEEFNKANITEKTYKELKEKYEKRLKEINEKLGIKEKKESLLDKLLKKEKKEEVYKKEETEGPVFIDPLNPPKEIEEVKVEETKPLTSSLDIELEKIRAFIESLRDTDKALNEQIRTLAESIGEVRSLAFQTDGSLKELEMKFEKLESDVEELRPEKIEKRIREIEKNLEAFEVFKEKTDKKLEDIGERVAKINEMLKSIGSIENFARIGKEIKQKSEEIKEAIGYIEKIAAKVERAFVETNKNLEDFFLFKSKQESLEETVREISKNLESINTKLENVLTIKDLDAFRTEISLIKAQLEEINKVLPIAEAKIPETIKNLREEKENILLLIKTLESDLQTGRISIGDYEESKRKALERLRKIDEELVEEWKKIEKFLETGGLEALPLEERKEEKVKEKLQEEKEEKTKTEMQEVEKENIITPAPIAASPVQVEKEEKEKKQKTFEPKFIEPAKVENEKSLFKILKKVKEEI